MLVKLSQLVHDIFHFCSRTETALMKSFCFVVWENRSLSNDKRGRAYTSAAWCHSANKNDTCLSGYETLKTLKILFICSLVKIILTCSLLLLPCIHIVRTCSANEVTSVSVPTYTYSMVAMTTVSVPTYTQSVVAMTSNDGWVEEASVPRKTCFLHPEIFEIIQMVNFEFLHVALTLMKVSK